MKVTLFLDVDGVMSPFPHGSKAWPDFVRHKYGFNLSLSQQMADALAALPADLVFLTTWEHLANQVIVPKLGWEPLPVIARAPYSEWPWWKLNVIKEFDENVGAPFIWADDDIKYNFTEIEQALPFPTATVSRPPQRMLISPETGEGLTPDHIMAMSNFIDSWRYL